MTDKVYKSGMCVHVKGSETITYDMTKYYQFRNDRPYPLQNYCR